MKWTAPKIKALKGEQKVTGLRLPTFHSISMVAGVMSARERER